MPFEHIPDASLAYFLVAYDENGNERKEVIDGAEQCLSEIVIETLRTEPVTDVFIMSHGWKGDLPAARNQYRRWVGAMAMNAADRARMRAVCPAFMPLIIGLHWPSLPWGDEELGVGGGVAFAIPDGAAFSDSLDALVDRYAARIADTAQARAALRTIVEAALDDIAPARLPASVLRAYEVLDAESGLGSDGCIGAPGADREPFDAELAYQHARQAVTSYGGGSLYGVLAPLRQLTYWTMKDRARRFGENGAHRLLARIEREAPHVRIHLMGHSFGCVVVSAMLVGTDALPRPVDSLALVQGALSLWSYSADIPVAPGKAGYFHSIVADRRVTGPIVATQSWHDTALSTFYPIAAGIAMQIVYAPGEWPRYAAIGTHGIRGIEDRVIDMTMLSADGDYGFQPGQIYNIDSSAYICERQGSSGAHSDIAKPEVAHAMWEASRLHSGS